MHIERELKFRLPAEAGKRLWALLPGAPAPTRRRLDSVYLDTPEFRLRAARAALRLRRDGRARIVCFKSDSPATQGVPERREWEAPAPRGGLAPGALPCDEIAAAAGVDLRALASSLEPVFETRFVRRSAAVELEDGSRVEVCLDVGTIRAGRLSAPLRELELELLEGSAASMLALAERLVEPLRLELEARSKAERGYALIDSRPATPRKAQPPRLGRGMSAEQAMLAIVEDCRAQVQWNAYGTIRSPDPEFLHQLRIGLRRLRSALRAFEPLVPKAGARATARELKSIMAGLGAARDWDVLHAMLSQRIAPPAGRDRELARLLAEVRARRRAARNRAREALASAAFQVFLLHSMRLSARAAAQPAKTFARRVLAREERKALRHARRIDWGDAAARHRLRILVKRLRYACEFFAGALPAGAARAYLERLEAVQDILGELNDLAATGRLLTELSRDGDARGLAFLRKRLAAREATLAAQLRPAWRRWAKRACFA